MFLHPQNYPLPVSLPLHGHYCLTAKRGDGGRGRGGEGGGRGREWGVLKRTDYHSSAANNAEFAKILHFEYVTEVHNIQGIGYKAI